MTDTTLIYYTASVVREPFGQRIRAALLANSGDLHIISVSQKPLDFGQNICVGDIGVTPYNVYKQLLVGAKEATTKNIVCCEDDTLYSPEHITTPPPFEDAFCYNITRWWIESSGVFRWRDRAAMCACIVNREFAIEVLERRFEKFPTPLPGRQSWRIFGEPGRCEVKLQLPTVKLHRYRTEKAVVTFNHRGTLGGKRKMDERDQIVDNLPLWGNAAELWEECYE